ncbi:hypothetical protein X798_03572 [Onchocerca flexuosa]|uniref:Uncharacterized protein n=2 Tax=Onchocerca flexuosa TaxID=387005 RepID=A0A183H5A2_9BILA|nr:hypothetical protein X798_03572 [Onchocerca flexuosa]VDO33787.1 unnamed protein product [Onchocerca flexuosa]
MCGFMGEGERKEMRGCPSACGPSLLARLPFWIFCFHGPYFTSPQSLFYHHPLPTTSVCFPSEAINSSLPKLDFDDL